MKLVLPLLFVIVANSLLSAQLLRPSIFSQTSDISGLSLNMSSEAIKQIIMSIPGNECYKIFPRQPYMAPFEDSIGNRFRLFTGTQYHYNDLVVGFSPNENGVYLIAKTLDYGLNPPGPIYDTVTRSLFTKYGTPDVKTDKVYFGAKYSCFIWLVNKSWVPLLLKQTPKGVQPSDTYQQIMSQVKLYFPFYDNFQGVPDAGDNPYAWDLFGSSSATRNVIESKTIKSYGTILVVVVRWQPDQVEQMRMILLDIDKAETSRALLSQKYWKSFDDVQTREQEQHASVKPDF